MPFPLTRLPRVPPEPTRDQILTEIRAFVVAVFRDGRGQGIHELAPLVTSGIVDSAGVLQIVDWLERRFHVAIDDAEVNLANFNTLAALTTLVLRKRGGPPPPSAPAPGPE